MKLTTIADFAVSDSTAETQLVLLPGAYMTARDFFDYGFIDAVRRQSWPVDIIAVETGTDSYLDNTIVQRLYDEIIHKAYASGARKIWLAGISVGAMGALLFTQRHREMIAGLLLLSPFIGSRGIVDEVRQAGGIRQWHPGDRALLVEQQLLKWLNSYRPNDPEWPEIHLAYGRNDRFVAAHRLLADILPENNVLVADGGHDWVTWNLLWKQLVETCPFSYPQTMVPA